ncbi:hypothetical protein JTE90_009925 [Oedothorax gibbosus]|uniref:Phosphatidic acid phosphatase type 2/haloperoxidase domain-containing protein n=1 Tax=Oedothorax gibbosus TaxID=931172 RepID=A0AAV6UUP1_9ARAC|nr:hypothetical protein JTE90_009925 [Oedothorax gibbosus]
MGLSYRGESPKIYIKEDNMSKAEVTFLDELLNLDKSLSLSLSLSASKTAPLGNYRPHMKALEYSCHGVFWICGSIVGLWFANTLQREAFFFNLILALFLDILFVGILKAAFHRRRPSNNEADDMFMTFSIDKMSCPSGHTSRAVLLTLLLVASSPGWGLLHLVLFTWCTCTCASRVLLGRHYVGDVCIGVVLGYFEYQLMNVLWAGPETADCYIENLHSSQTSTTHTQTRLTLRPLFVFLFT